MKNQNWKEVLAGFTAEPLFKLEGSEFGTIVIAANMTLYESENGAVRLIALPSPSFYLLFPDYLDVVSEEIVQQLDTEDELKERVFGFTAKRVNRVSIAKQVTAGLEKFL